MLYFDRRVTKTEIAHRVANITPDDMAEACTKWFHGGPSITNWGPMKGIQ